MSVSTHVLDTGSGTPAAGVPVRLDLYAADSWRLVQEGETDPAGRWVLAPPPPETTPAPAAAPVADGALVANGTRAEDAPSGTASGTESGVPVVDAAGGLAPGTYRLRFGSGRYFAARDVESYYPEITVIFLVTGPGQRHHVPLALGPFGYSTYRGS